MCGKQCTFLAILSKQISYLTTPPKLGTLLLGFVFSSLLYSHFGLSGLNLMVFHVLIIYVSNNAKTRAFRWDGHSAHVNEILCVKAFNTCALHVMRHHFLHQTACYNSIIVIRHCPNRCLSRQSFLFFFISCHAQIST